MASFLHFSIKAEEFQKLSMYPSFPLFILTLGKGASGIGKPRNWHRGAQPSFTLNTNSCFSGTRSLESFQKFFEFFWKFFEKFLKSFWKVFEKFLKSFWKVFENYFETFLDVNVMDSIFFLHLNFIKISF